MTNSTKLTEGGSPKPIIFHALAYLKQQYKFWFIPELEADDLVAFILSRIIARPLSALLTKMYCISV